MSALARTAMEAFWLGLVISGQTRHLDFHSAGAQVAHSSDTTASCVCGRQLIQHVEAASAEHIHLSDPLLQPLQVLHASDTGPVCSSRVRTTQFIRAAVLLFTF